MGLNLKRPGLRPAGWLKPEMPRQWRLISADPHTNTDSRAYIKQTKPKCTLNEMFDIHKKFLVNS